MINSGGTVKGLFGNGQRIKGDRPPTHDFGESIPSKDFFDQFAGSVKGFGVSFRKEENPHRQGVLLGQVKPCSGNPNGFFKEKGFGKLNGQAGPIANGPTDSAPVLHGL